MSEKCELEGESMHRRWRMYDNKGDFLSRPVIGGWRTLLPLTAATLLFGSGVLLLGHDLDTLPKKPVPKDSRTYPLEEHSAVVFGTLRETALVYGALIAGLAVGAIGLGNEKRIRARIGTQEQASSSLDSPESSL